MFSDAANDNNIQEIQEKGEIKTIEAYVSGQVQGVGFRACARKIALGLSLTGEVMNLDDGRVYLVATGENVILEKFISSLYECPRAYLREISCNEITKKEFSDFTILRNI
ncbi:acylphosphatase [Methanoplanus sp. FWC-SCC4]|uniref:acylphosphatase n=2 Tax=Methanochimaera problematica TaxID=2609417 RepID=A0AA97FEJ8_9EURY|nr:acylphosphatase [Methanoplanus sp. FWC-SCC4]